MVQWHFIVVCGCLKLEVFQLFKSYPDLQDKLSGDASFDAVLIAGPTASGKSALALDIARQLSGVVINADSMQVYEELSILTARPTPAEQGEVPHRLYGVLAGDDPCSAGRFAEMATSEIQRAVAQKQIPIFVGGTGLYFQALLEGIAPIPDIASDVRAEARSRFEVLGSEKFKDLLRKIDPDFVGALEVLDRQRMIRALEVYEQTGKPLSFWQSQKGQPVLDGQILRIVLDVDRAELYRRCDARFLAMVEKGALGEVEALLQKRLSPDLPVMKAVGVRELAGVLDNKLSLEDACIQAQTATRRLAKRQLTWIKSHMIAWNRVKS